MSARRVTTRAALDRDLTAEPDLTKRLVKLRLLVPVARGPRLPRTARAVYYDLGARDLVERAATFVAAGYATKDIAHLLGKLATNDKPRVIAVIGREALADRVAVAEERIDAWLDAGLIEPWGVDEGGAALFARVEIKRARLLAALDCVGFGERAGDWLAGGIERAAARRHITAVADAARLLLRSLPKSPRAPQK